VAGTAPVPAPLTSTAHARTNSDTAPAYVSGSSAWTTWPAPATSSEGLAQHRPAVDAEFFAHRFAVGDQVGDGQCPTRLPIPLHWQWRGPVHAALVDADQPDRLGEQVPLDGHEVMAALPGATVQEQQRRGGGITPDVGVKP
jgi:hypothetical protein